MQFSAFFIFCTQSSSNDVLVCVCLRQVHWQAVRPPWLVRELFSLNQLGPPASLQSSQCGPHGLTPTLKGAIQPHTARQAGTDTHTLSVCTRRP